MSCCIKNIIDSQSRHLNPTDFSSFPINFSSFPIIICVDFSYIIDLTTSNNVFLFQSTLLQSQLSLASPKGHKEIILYLVAKEYISIFQFLSLFPPPPSFFVVQEITFPQASHISSLQVHLSAVD